MQEDNKNLTENKVRKLNYSKLTDDAKKIYNNLKNKIKNKIIKKEEEISKNNYQILNDYNRAHYKKNEDKKNIYKRKTESEYFNNLRNEASSVNNRNRRFYTSVYHNKNEFSSVSSPDYLGYSYYTYAKKPKKSFSFLSKNIKN